MNRTHRNSRRTPRVLAGALLCALLATLPAAAITYEVDTSAGSFDFAIGEANAATVAAGGNLSNDIIFPEVVADSSVQLASGGLTTTTTVLTIDGTEPGGLSLLGDGATFLTIGGTNKVIFKNLVFDNGALLLDSGATASFDVVDTTLSIDQVIADTTTGGILAKTGDGTLKLTGANTFTGGADIGGGTLQVGAGALASDATVNSGATLRFLHNVDDTYAGAISGEGVLEKEGTGILTLTGANAFTGGTTITEGGIAGAPGAVQGDVLIQSGTTLDLIDIGTNSYEGAISGTGTLIKSGSGTLTLTNTANSWTDLQINDGILTGEAATLSGNVNIATAATLWIDEDGTGTIAGDLSGDGLIEKFGMGTATLSGNNAGLTSTAANAITLTEGTLIGNTTSIPTPVTVGMGLTLVFDQSASANYDPKISGSGGNFEKRGAGTLTFTGNQTYDGTTTVSAGQLNVLAALASDANVANGAFLGGTGSIAGAVSTLGSSATIRPGTSIGTLSVDNIQFASGGVLEIEVDNAGADLLAVTNAADLTSSTLDIKLLGSNYTNQVETILTAGSITGTLTIQSIFPLVDITMQTFANSVQLTLNSNGGMIGTIGTSPNQRAVGTSLDAETPLASGDLAMVIEGFSSLTLNEFSAALDSLSGETLSQFATARLEHANRFDGAIHARLRESSDSLDAATRLQPKRPRGEGLLPEVSAGGSVAAGERLDIWFEPYVAFGEIDGNKGESDVDYTLVGGALGLEGAPFAAASSPLRDVRMGAAFAYGNSDIDFADRNGSGTAHSYMGALYAGWAAGRYRAGVSGRAGFSQMESERTITVGAIVRNAEAEFNGLDFGTLLEFGGKWIENENYLIESYGSVDYSHMERATVREDGADSVSLRIGREKIDSLRVGVGTRLRGVFDMEGGYWILPELRAEWHQQLLDRDRVVHANFRGSVAGSSFTVRGAELQSHSANVGLGWTVRSASGFEAGLDYDFGIDANRLAHAIGVRVGTHW